MSRHGVAETLTGAVVLVIAGGFLAFTAAHSGLSAATGYTLHARFDSVAGLPVGGDVRMAGVKVGSVTDEQIDPKTFTAVVSMTVRNDIQLPKDSSASIVSESLLGGNYISLAPGGSETDLKPGQTITITQSAVNLEQLLGKFIFSVTTLNGPKDGAAKDGAAKDGADKAGAGGALAPLPK